MPVVRRGERSFFGPGMIGQALAHAGGLVPTVERLGATAPAKSIGPTTDVGAGGATVYSNSGETETSLDSLPSGVYIVDARSSIQFADPCTDLYHRVDVNSASGDALGPPGGSVAPAATALVAANVTAVVVTVSPGSITATPTLSGGPGAATVQNVTIAAIRIAEA